MKRYSFPFILLVLTLSLSSCFTVEEVIHFHDDGSGEFRLRIDASMMMKALYSMGESEPADSTDPGKYHASPEMEAALDSIQGISNSNSFERKAYATTWISFDFESIEALNAGYSNLFHHNYDGPRIKEFFLRKKGALIRKDTDLATRMRIMDEMEIKSDDELRKMEGQSPIGVYIDKIEYKCVYTFDRPVKKFSNKATVRSSNGQILELHYFLFDPTLSYPNGIENKIRYRFTSQ